MMNYFIRKFVEEDDKAMRDLKGLQYFYERLKDALEYLKVVFDSPDFKTKSGEFKVMREKDWSNVSHILNRHFRGDDYVRGASVLAPGSVDNYSSRTFFPAISLRVMLPTGVKDIYGEDTWSSRYERYVLEGITTSQNGRLNPNFKTELDKCINFVNSELVKIEEAFKNHSKAVEKAKVLIQKVLKSSYELEDVLEKEVYPNMRLHYTRPYIRSTSNFFAK